MMEFMNDFTKLPDYPRSVVKMAAQALMPFAPILQKRCGRCWDARRMIQAPYPKVNPKYLEDATITYVVQINGKLRGRFDLPKDQSQEIVVDAARQHPIVSRYLAEGTSKR